MVEQTFEKALKKLEKNVQELEKGDLPLEKALAKFEEGVNLSKLCSAKLDEIDKKITLLMQDGDGRISEHPFTERNKGKTDLDV